MLERAKACLNSQAGGTLQHTHSSLRSRRALHPTFWSHGAGDLELPAYIASSIHPPSNPTSGHCCPSDPAIKTHDGSWRAQNSDRPFLDFLYPPPAIRLLARSSTCSQTFERWDSSHARQMWSGVPQTVRRVHNMTQAGWAALNIKRFMKSVELDQYVRRSREAKAKKRKEYRGQEGRGLLSEPGNWARAIRRRSVILKKDRRYAAARVPTSRPNLLKFLSATREERPLTLPRVEQAWRIYRRMDKDSRTDDRLNTEFVCWLSLAGTGQRDLDCLKLYFSIRKRKRTVGLYRAILVIFERNDLWIKASQMHREAMKILDNVEPVTVAFFRLAVRNGRWDTAMTIEARHREINPGIAQQEMFWVKVADIPQLLERSLKLQVHLQKLERASGANDDIRAFCGRFFKEALAQEFMHSGRKDFKTWFNKAGARLPLVSLARLFEYLSARGPEHDEFIGRMLLAIVQDERFDPLQIHLLVQTVYGLLRDRAYPLPPETMIALLGHYCSVYTRGDEALIEQSLSIVTLVEDYERLHGTASPEFLGLILRHLAHSGLNEQLEHWFEYFTKHHPSFHSIEPYLWTKVDVHARRANPIKALEAFSEVEKLTRQNGEAVGLRSYSALILAFSRVDDLQAAVDLLSTMVQKKLEPNVYIYHPIMDMMANRGDAAGILNFISAIQTQLSPEERINSEYFGSLLTAYMRRGDVEQAEAVLERTIKGVKEHQIKGSLTYIFRRMIAGYGRQRDAAAAFKTFRKMKLRGIRTDAATYAGLISIMCSFRRSEAAEQILRKEMVAANVAATANEYAAIMRGYNHQNLYEAALKVHARMKRENIRPSLESQTAYIEAKAGQETRESLLELRREKMQQSIEAQDAFTDAAAGQNSAEKVTPGKGFFLHPNREETRKVLPLHKTINELREMIKKDPGREIANSRRLVAAWPKGIDDVSGAYFSYLMYVHGRHNSFRAVEELLELYTEFAQRHRGDAMKVTPPFRMLSSLMLAHLKSSNHEEVGRLWDMATELADKITIGVGPDAVPDILALQNPLQDAADTSKHAETEPAGTEPAVTEPQLSRPSITRTNYLELPLRHYMASLAKQGKVREAIELVPRLIARGYMLDTHTWNRLIRFLCRREPPMALIAFVLTERFLMPGWQGWLLGSARDTFPPTASLLSGLQFTRSRYLRPGELVPQYATMVFLASTLARLRHLQASGLSYKGQDADKDPQLVRYVGTPAEIYDKAPQTVKAIQSMPNVPANWQQEHLLPNWEPWSRESVYR